MPTIRMEQVTKTYPGRAYATTAVRDIDLVVEQGEFLFLVGSRGAGKSTLLDLIAGKVKPDRGRIYLDDKEVTAMTKTQSDKIRNCIGRVGQNSFLKRNETVYNNLSSERRVMGFFKKRVLDMTLADKALAIVGMPGSGNQFPRDLTTPECRRILVAKAIQTSPAILLLDDFTARLDEDTTGDMLYLLNELNRKGTTIFMATNSSYVVNSQRRRVVTLADGMIVGDVQKGRYGYIG